MRTLTYIGKADFGYPAYRDEDGKLWANINFQYTDQSGLHSLTGNSLDGEPNEPFPVALGETVSFENEPDPEAEKYSLQYQMLGRLKSDCDYFLGYGFRNEKDLWAGSVERQILKMKEIWNTFPAELKPEWLSMEEIDEYERKMSTEGEKA
ncbi:MAG: hypothetical protein LUE86_14085 [Clostridiales bacterium]|nr:hypothetical protein [Clostridiales bacterium]